MSNQVVKDIEEKGFTQSRFLISTANHSDGDSQAFAIIQWNKAHEDAF
jgi:hypothetical protein